MEASKGPGHLRLWFLVAVLVTAAASGGGVYVYEQYTTHLTVTGVNWGLFVNNTSYGYVFEDPSVGCGETENCPSNAVIGTVWTDLVPFTYGPAEFNLTVRNMTISPSFEILSSIPQIPVFLVPGQGVIFFHIAIHLPGNSCSYSPLGEIWVSK